MSKRPVSREDFILTLTIASIRPSSHSRKYHRFLCKGNRKVNKRVTSLFLGIGRLNMMGILWLEWLWPSKGSIFWYREWIKCIHFYFPSYSAMDLPRQHWDEFKTWRMLLVIEKQDLWSSSGGRLSKAFSSQYSFRSLEVCQSFLFQGSARGPVRKTSQLKSMTVTVMSDADLGRALEFASRDIKLQCLIKTLNNTPSMDVSKYHLATENNKEIKDRG